jgi:hypothetical protein
VALPGRQTRSEGLVWGNPESAEGIRGTMVGFRGLRIKGILGKKLLILSVNAAISLGLNLFAE